MTDVHAFILGIFALVAATATQGEVVQAIVVFATGVAVGCLLVVAADAYSRRHGR